MKLVMPMYYHDLPTNDGSLEFETDFIFNWYPT